VLPSVLKKELKCRHFEATEVIGAELQAVLNTPTEHDFQYVFKNGRSAGKRDTSRVVVAANRPKVSF
jgi:hypothetical protein